MTPEEKKLQKLQQILSIADQDYVTTDDFNKAVDLLVAHIKGAVGVNDTYKKEFVKYCEQEVKDARNDIEGAKTDFKKALEELVKKANSLKNGKDGRDGHTPVKGVDYFDGKDGEKGDKGDAGDIKELSPDEIRDALEILEGDDRLDKSAIKGIDEIEKMAKLNAVPVTTSFINGQRAKNIHVNGATVSVQGDTAYVTTADGGGGGAVDSVNGQTGVVVLDTDDIAEGSTNKYWTGWTRTLIVDQGGLGDYTTIKDACDYVATQTPSTSNRWQILVMNGLYLENAFTIPTYTTVNGFIPTTWGGFEAVTIDMTTTVTSGTGIDLTSFANLANVVVKWSNFSGGQTGDIDLILSRGNNKLTGLYVQAFTSDTENINAIKLTGSVLYAYGLTVEIANLGSGSVRGIYETGGDISGYYDRSRINSYVANQWGYEKDTTSGTSKLYGMTFDGPSSIKRTGSGAVAVRNTSYVDNSGTITYAGDFAVADEAYGAGWNGSQEVPTKNALYDKIETVIGTIPDNLTDFTAQTAWRVFYSNTDGDVTELALGADGTFLKSNGASSAPSFAVPAGSGGGITRTVTTSSGAFTAGATADTDYVYLIAGAHAVALPTAVGNTNRYTFKNNHSAAITITPDGVETIEGGATLSLNPLASVDLISNNSVWFVI